VLVLRIMLGVLMFKLLGNNGLGAEMKQTQHCTHESFYKDVKTKVYIFKLFKVRVDGR
jgi:hypothetical protein